MDIQFCELYLSIPQVGIVEVENYWQLPYPIPILAGNPDRPIEDWYHCQGKGRLWFIFLDTKPEADVSVEFIDPDGISRGKYTKTLLADQAWSTHYVEFDKIGLWKLRGTLNGITETWDALDVAEVPVPPPPPPDPIQDILCWNPYTQLFQSDFIDVEQDLDIGVKFTVENILLYTNTFRIKVRLNNAAGGSQLFWSNDFVLNPGDKSTFDCKRIGGWNNLGLATADIYVYRVVGGGIGGYEWANLGAPIANIVTAQPPPEDFGLEITQYQRI